MSRSVWGVAVLSVVVLVVGCFAGAGATIALLFSAARELSAVDACDGWTPPDPVVVGDTAVVAVWEKDLVAIDGTGGERWRVTLPDWPLRLQPQPRGVAVQLEDEDAVLGARYLWISDAGVVEREWRSHCPVTSAGQIYWTCPAEGEIAAVDATTGAQRAVFDANVGELTQLSANVRTGSLWLSERADGWPQLAHTLTRLAPDQAQPVIVQAQHTRVLGLPDDGALVTVVTPEAGSETFEVALIHLDPQGEQTWRRELGVVDALRVAEVGQPALVGSRAAVGTASGVVVLGLDGSEQRLPETADDFPALIGAQQGWFAVEDGTLARIDDDGSTRWRFQQDFCSIRDVFEAGDTTYAWGDHNGWGYLFAIEEGRLSWEHRHRGDGGVGPQVCAWREWRAVMPVGERSVLISAALGHHRLLDPSGEELWSVPQ